MFSKITISLIALGACSTIAWPYGEQKIRGVNLGSWLVLERWMNPTDSGVFAGLPESVTDEYALCEHLGYSAAEQRLRAHWNTWITEDHFAFWASTGLNHVRLPIGYWALDIQPGEPWVNGSWEYVVKAAEWSKKHNLQLSIDLHGAPGSQNGWDHSGRSGDIGFFTDENIQRAVNVIGRIAQWSIDFKDTVTIIQLINEPNLWDAYDYRLGRLKDYYGLAYKEVRKYNPDVVVAVSDAFIDAVNWYYFGELPEYHSVMLDIHMYQVFGDEWRDMTCAQHRDYPCTYHERLIEASSKLWTVVGEWSIATPGEFNCDEQGYFARQQIGAFEKAEGWFMWAHYNGQNMREWSFNHSFANNWINPAGDNSPQCPDQDSGASSFSFYLSLFGLSLLTLLTST
ncbi:putative glucan 1,3-beta-glucosidase A [Pseudolycoriella hygida]|uniref:glucan 1,3-beta-glucosidase n=1 Tax=Pseudolycoriella hygida TaxID=35572 RepID=A0A9Q0RWF1_9DIPT|nr:putative glucan 1,3-beta-glucosidase A [Pseudolycoriella hygida]